MDHSDDKDAPPPAPAHPPKSDASGHSAEREARRAAALRDNLRKRKAPPRRNE